MRVQHGVGFELVQLDGPLLAGVERKAPEARAGVVEALAELRGLHDEAVGGPLERDAHELVVVDVRALACGQPRQVPGLPRVRHLRGGSGRLLAL